MSDCFQFSLKGTTINKTSRHSLLGALDTACISLMDWLSYSDSAVLLSLNRHFPAPDCALQAAVFPPLSFPCYFRLQPVHKQPPKQNNQDLTIV